MTHRSLLQRCLSVLLPTLYAGTPSAIHLVIVALSCVICSLSRQKGLQGYARDTVHANRFRSSFLTVLKLQGVITAERNLLWKLVEAVCCIDSKFFQRRQPACPL